MKQYNGIIVDNEGFTVFEFITPPVNKPSDADKLAIAICEAWCAANTDQPYYWDVYHATS